MTVQIWLLTGTSLFFLLACGTRLSAVSDKAQIPQCPAVTSLLELPDMQACRQLMTLAEDPWQGCPALRPVVDPEGPASRLQQDEAAVLDTADAKDPKVTDSRAALMTARQQQQRPRQHGLRASQLCCTAAKLFIALRCNCWQGLDPRTLEYLADQAAMCGPLPSAVEAVNPADSLVKRVQEEGGSRRQAAAGSQEQPQLHQQDQPRRAIDQQQQRQRPWDATADVQAELPGSRERSSVRLYAAVISGAVNRDKRDAIRATWGSDKRLHRLVFVCAKPHEEAAFDALRAEAVAQRDLVVVPHVWEHYTNITHQTFEAARAAALDPQMTHLLKVDDDSFVRVGPLLERLRATGAGPSFLGNMEIPGGRPHRDKANKWYVSPEEWPSSKYPPWAHGAGYVLTADLVREIAAGAALKPQQHRLFKLEDIAMGSWVQFIGAERGMKVKYLNDGRFNYVGCSAYDMVSHYFDAGRTYCTWAARGQCCSKAEGELFAAQMKKLGGDVVKLHAWQPKR